MDTSFGRTFGQMNPRGFTLVEVMIAMVVATVGLLSLSMMLINAMRVNSMGNKATQATFLAQDMLERIKDGNLVHDGTFGFMDMSASDTGMVQDAGFLYGINESGEAEGSFNVQWKVFTHTHWSRKVTVDVSWRGHFGLARSVNLVSISRGEGN